MIIDNADLLQVDITAVLGILIFLTIGQRAAERRYFTVTTAFMVIPFAISGLIVLVDDTWLGSNYLDEARFMAALGFLLIILYFGIIIAKDEWRGLKEWWRNWRSRRAHSGSDRAGPESNS